jgi:transposase-like protein
MPENAAELREKHDVDDAVFLVDGATPLKDACNRHGLDFRYEVTEIATASNVSFER